MALVESMIISAYNYFYAHSIIHHYYLLLLYFIVKVYALSVIN